MPPTAVLFCHGLDTGPFGRKYHALIDAGIDLVAPDFQGMDLAARVAHLLPILGRYDAPVVVGSSYGGITALCAARLHADAGGRLAGLLLCAPALARTEPPAAELRRRTGLRPPAPTVVIHGLRDEVIPIAVSRDFAHAHPDRVELVEVDDDHGLAGSLDRIVAATRDLMAAARA
jgi:pimeloyl-ACP methyl ester carboxylesterase